MSTRSEAPATALDALVVDALAAALSDADPSRAAPVAPSAWPLPAIPDLPPPSTSGLPSPALPQDFPTETVSAPNLFDLIATPHRAAGGDVASVSRLDRAASRRDPIGGLDPLPWGRDSVTHSTASIASGREAGQHWPELMAFRLSDDFPAGPFDPAAAAAHAADNALPAATFPAASPIFTPIMRPPDAPSPPYAPHVGNAGVPPWLESPSPADQAPRDVASVRPGRDPLSAATTNAPPADQLPAWLVASGTPPASSSPDRREDRLRPEKRPARGIRDDFPALGQEVHGRPLVWLDNAATTQKPRAVIDAISAFYERDNSNVHRGAHELAARATDAYEAARGKVQRFLHARSAKEIIFVRGATEAINLVAQSWGRRHVRAGDVILVTHLEHHSNIVPWFQLCEASGAVLRVIPVDDAGNVRLDAYEAMLDQRVKLVAITQVSNALGTIVPVAPMAAMAHRYGARVLVDGAQAVAHVPVDAQCLGADFYALSGHKIYGPTGIGVLYGREEVLEDMPPWQGGGSMIQDVTFEQITYAALPARFEAGTPHLSGAVGLGAALDYVERIGRPAIIAHEQGLLSTMLAGLATVPGLTIVGSPAARVGVVSFVLAGHTAQAVGQHLNRHGIAVRAGHHCAQPILRRFGHEATVRPSLGIYNDDDDVARLIDALRGLTHAHTRG